MTVLDDLRKNVDPTPLYAVVGATDLAVEKAREARVDLTKRAEQARADLTPATVQARAVKVADQVKELPALAINQGMVVSGKVAEGYVAQAAADQCADARIVPWCQGRAGEGGLSPDPLGGVAGDER